MTKQQRRVLMHLVRHQEIDPMVAWFRLGVYRLSAVIHELRKDHNIVTERKKVVNRWGESCNVATYRLVRDKS